METILYDVTHTSYIRFTKQNKNCLPLYLISDAKVNNLSDTTKLFKLMKVKS